jgi:hypothetical protein|tara:strand:- start:254 stop:2209 length:1956 start_codon:yes stop_codon:yes gene_type:complete
MASSNKITDDDLLARIQGELTDSLGYGDTISQQREKSMEYYYGLPFGNEVEGRSQFVDSTVQDTIEWIKPSLMRIFASGDEMVKFSPVGPEDVEAAKQATDYVNYVFTKDNPGWEILYSWFTDALMQKNGIVKCWWDEYPEVEREEYHNLTEVEFESLVNDVEVEVVEHTQGDAEQGEPVHDIVIKRTNQIGTVKVENVPPNEFLIARESKTIQDSKFVCHRVEKTLSELREMYPDEDLDSDDLSAGSDDIDEFSAERLSRYMYDNSSQYDNGWGFSEPNEEALQIYWLHESYLKTDWDGDGIAELRKVCTVGDRILANDAIDNIPFVSLTPVKIPHKFFGLSVADLVMDLQLMKSTLMRTLMDNMYNQNFGRYAVLEGQANLDDLLTQRPGGIVRVKSPNAVMPLATPTLEPYSFQMLEYLDGVRESRAGVSRMSQGLDENALTSHTTATAVNAVMTASQSRLELIARNFAETGVKELMSRIYELLLKNQDKQRVVMLRNEWVPVRPNMWKDKYDCTVSVALGHGNKDQQLVHLSTMMQFASQAMAGGLNIVSEKNLYNMGAALIKNMGFQNVDDFLTDPEKVPQEPSAEEQMAQADLQIRQKELEIKSADVQIKAQKVKVEMMKAKSDAQIKAAEVALEVTQQRPVGIG